MTYIDCIIVACLNKYTLGVVLRGTLPSIVKRVSCGSEADFENRRGHLRNSSSHAQLVIVEHARRPSPCVVALHLDICLVHQRTSLSPKYPKMEPHSQTTPSGVHAGTPAESRGSDGHQQHAASAYTFSNIFSQAKNVSVSDLSSSRDSILQSPCFKKSFLWAAGIAALLAVHRLRQGGTNLRAANDAVLGYLGTFGAQWYLCRRDEHDKKLALRAFYQNQAAMRSQMRPTAVDDLAPGLPGSASGGADAAPGGEDDWRAEIERLTAYELPKVEKGSTESITMR